MRVYVSAKYMPANTKPNQFRPANTKTDHQILNYAKEHVLPPTRKKLEMRPFFRVGGSIIFLLFVVFPCFPTRALSITRIQVLPYCCWRFSAKTYHYSRIKLFSWMLLHAVVEYNADVNWNFHLTRAGIKAES